MKTTETILITGGAGFIGCALARKFLDEGHCVKLYDSFMRDSLQYYPGVKEHENLEVIQADIRDKQAVSDAIGDTTIVFHLAAIAGVSKYFTIPVEVMEVNILGTYNMLEAAKNNPSIKAFFDFSTSEIYGSNCFLAEEHGDIKAENLFAKRWTYAASKVASEKLGLAYYWQHKVPFIGIRPFNIYGPGQVGEGVISYFINSLLNGKGITITDTGTQSRTYCYIDDFIHGIDVLLKNLDAAIGTSFNIGQEDGIISVKDLAKLVCRTLNTEIEFQYVPHAGDDVMVRSPSVAKLKKLGYSPQIDLEQGLQKTCDWYQQMTVKLD